MKKDLFLSVFYQDCVTRARTDDTRTERNRAVEPRDGLTDRRTDECEPEIGLYEQRGFPIGEFRPHRRGNKAANTTLVAPSIASKPKSWEKQGKLELTDRRTDKVSST